LNLAFGQAEHAGSSYTLVVGGIRPDAWVIVNVTDSIHRFGGIFSGAFGRSAVDEAGQENFTVFNLALDIGRVDPSVGSQPVVHVIRDALI